MKRIIVILCLLVLTGGCAASIDNLSANYTESSAAVHQFAKITAQDWLLGSGMLAGALPADSLPAWFFEEMQKVDDWARAGEFDDWQLGYMMGLRVRLAGPAIKGMIEQYAPALTGITEVAAVLSFLGL